MIYCRIKPQTHEAMQHTGSNDQEMVNWAPDVLTADPETRKLYFEWPPGNVKHEVLATTWVVKRNDWYENVRNEYFQRTYEEVPTP